MRAPAGQTSLSMVAKTDPAVYVQEACWWVRRNPEGFRRLMALLHRQVDRGNPRSQRSMVYLYAEREGIAIESGEGWTASSATTTCGRCWRATW